MDDYCGSIYIQNKCIILLFISILAPQISSNFSIAFTRGVCYLSFLITLIKIREPPLLRFFLPKAEANLYHSVTNELTWSESSQCSVRNIKSGFVSSACMKFLNKDFYELCSYAKFTIFHCF